MGTRDRLLRAAMEVVQSQGISGATTAEIARVAGCSEGALYYHFDDKQALIAAALREYMPEIVAYFRQFPERAGTGEVLENLESFSRTVMAYFQQIISISAATLSDPDLLQRHHRDMHHADTGPAAVYHALASYIAAEQARHRVDEHIEPAAAASLLAGALHTRVFLQRFLHWPAEECEQEQFIHDVIDVLLRGLAPAAEEA